MFPSKHLDNLLPDRVDAQNHRGLDTFRILFKQALLKKWVVREKTDSITFAPITAFPKMST